MEQGDEQSRYTEGQQVYEKVLLITFIRELQIKMEMSYNLKQVRFTNIKK